MINQSLKEFLAEHTQLESKVEEDAVRMKCKQTSDVIQKKYVSSFTRGRLDGVRG